MKKSYIIAIVGTIFALILSVILIFTLFSFDHIEDTNGTITNLETIKITDMINTKNSKYIANWSSLRNSGNTTGVDGKLEEFDYDYIKYTSKKLSGIMTINATYVKEYQELSILVENELLSGNLEIIVVAPDNTVVGNVKVNSKEKIEIKDTKEGIYKVIIGGESAEFKIHIERNIN